MRQVSKEKMREDELFIKARKTMQELADLSNTAPINKQIMFKLACLQWQMKQRYRSEGVAYYISRRAYNEDLDKIRKLKDKIIAGGKCEAKALEAVDEAKEYLVLIAGHRVREKNECRVF